MKYYLVTYQWKTRRAREWTVVNIGAETECMGLWWMTHLKKAREAVEEAQVNMGREVWQIDYSDQDTPSETHRLLSAVEITEAGYDALEEAEIGH